MSDFITLKLPESEKAAFSRWIDQQKEENKKEVKKLVRQTLDKISKRAKQFVSVDKGFLKTSIRAVSTKEGYGGIVEVGRHYSPYVEFGTGSVFVAGQDVMKYAEEFKRPRPVKRKVNLRAQPYFFPAVRISQKEMMARLEQMGFKRK